LTAEIKLFAACQLDSNLDLGTELSLFRRSYGKSKPAVEYTGINNSKMFNIDYSLSSLMTNYIIFSQSYLDCRLLIKYCPDFPDVLINYCIQFLIGVDIANDRSRAIFSRLASLLLLRFPNRPDLIFQLISHYSAYSVLKNLPHSNLEPNSIYTSASTPVFYFQSLWVKGKYEQLLINYAGFFFHGRSFPESDFLLRTFSVLGLHRRVMLLFRSIYFQLGDNITLTTVSNMLFIELGSEKLDNVFIGKLVSDFHKVSKSHAFLSSFANRSKYIAFQVDEKPTIAIVSPDLRQHPVGKFWHPIAHGLEKDFRLVHVALNAGFQNDSIRDNLKNISFEWNDFLSEDDPISYLDNLNPSCIIDLGGHTADSRPSLLNYRLAPLQITYLGFYGPSYGSQCDWWILDKIIDSYIAGSYPGSEKVWKLPCPSLCYDPSIHGLPSLNGLSYCYSSHPIFGSFNHSRKLTSSCLSRFASILAQDKNSSLLFRSHSFYDPQVRRWFLSRFVDFNILAHQLVPIPYAPTQFDGYFDYTKIHIHLDTYPVCGTTTTLDSLAMGIPVLTSPNNLYAGAISSAIIEHAGFPGWIAENSCDLPQKASELFERYRTADSRRGLAQHIRSSSLCDTLNTPRIFSEQLKEMMKYSSLKR